MTPTPPLPGSDILVDQLREQLAAQPWHERFSNTVTSAAGAVVLIVWVAVAAGLDVPAEALSAVAAVISVLTTAGVLKTRNGITPRGVDRVERIAEHEYVGRRRAEP